MILDHFGFQRESDSENHGPGKYWTSGSSERFKSFKIKFRLRLKASEELSDKVPDGIILTPLSEFLVVEAKHINELGGSQSKQMEELLRIINDDEPGVCFVSFLDGRYANLLTLQEAQSKTKTHWDRIRSILRTFGIDEIYGM